MRLIILSTLLLFFNSIYTQEGSKIDLKNVDVATNRLPTILLFGDEYTIRDRDEFLESLIKSRFYSPDLEIVINLQEFISKRQFNFNIILKFFIIFKWFFIFIFNFRKLFSYFK